MLLAQHDLWCVSSRGEFGWLEIPRSNYCKTVPLLSALMSQVDKKKKSIRQEGLLLRYLSLVHKTLKHNIPYDFKSEELLEIEAQTRTRRAFASSHDPRRTFCR